MATIINISFKMLFLSKDSEHFQTGSWNADDLLAPVLFPKCLQGLRITYLNENTQQYTHDDNGP